MNAPPTDYETIKGYLLGQMPEEEESELETLLLTDPEFYEEFSISEDELIDQYLGGMLSDHDRASFESYFALSSERQQKIRFAMALRRHVLATARPDASEAQILTNQLKPSIFRRFIFPIRSPHVSYALAAAVLIILGGSLLMLWKYVQSPPLTGRVLAIELSPTPATRDGSATKQFVVTPDIESVRLQLDLPENEYASYEAALRDASLHTVFVAKNLKPQIVYGFAAVIMDVKADVVSPGDYRIQLSGITPEGRSETVATFAFTVSTK